MKLNEAVKEIIKMCNKSQTEVGNDIGMQSGAFSTMMKRNNMQVKTLVTICNKLGYEIVLRPTEGTNRKERTVIIDEAGLWFTDMRESVPKVKPKMAIV